MSVANSLSSPALPTPAGELNRKFIDIAPECPFDEMALALSGGGFRAAAFALGAISYLNRAWYTDEQDTLLQHVTFMTSTSGGTLTNSYYSAQLHKPNFSFGNFYRAMKVFLDGEALLNEVFAILNDPKRWDEIGRQTQTKNGKTSVVDICKSKNLINAFAKAYDSLLFADATYPAANLFDIYFQHRDVHLKSVCFNSTELNNGISFRFQTNGDPASIKTVGNYYLQFNDADVARKLKISDMAAASSCFPAGFEPICYPIDFVHPGLTDVDKMLKAIDYKNNNPLKLQEVTDAPFSLVDGGVVDNQALYSLMMEDNFRARNKPQKREFDLMMVCDVDSFFVDAYQTPKTSDSNMGSLSIDKLTKLMPYGLALFIVSLLLSVLCEGVLRRAGLLFLLPSLLYAVFYFYFLIQIQEQKASLAKSSWGNALIGHIGYFFKLPFNTLKQMLAARVSSALLIVSDLFLKQERRQYYDSFYNMPAYRNRTLSCLIYEFSLQHDVVRKANLKDKDSAWWPALSGGLDPSPQMQQIATAATAMGTTLWFDTGLNQTMRDDIIMCGQFTMCYNLLKHIYRLEELDQKWKTDQTLQGLKIRLKADWDLFIDKPDFML